MAGDGWSTMAFDQAVQVNPTVRLERGSVYQFVDMQAVDPGSRSVGPSELREFKGGGSRFMNGDTLMARITTPCLENGKIARYAASKGEEVGHGSTEFIVIRGRPNVTDNGFAYYLTKWDGVRQYCISQMTGSSGGAFDGLRPGQTSPPIHTFAQLRLRRCRDAFCYRIVAPGRGVWPYAPTNRLEPSKLRSPQLFAGSNPP